MSTTIASKIWIATCLLHRERPHEAAFDALDVIHKVEALPWEQPKRPALHAHLSQHCSANRPPSTYKLRYLYREEPGSKLRLFRQGDLFHPDRKSGRITPDLDQLPEEYRHLYSWYWSEYANRKAPVPAPDPILALRGVGKHMWRDLGGDQFIRQLRSDWFDRKHDANAASPAR